MPRGKENSVSKGGRGRRFVFLFFHDWRTPPSLQQTNNSREKVEFARDRAAIEFQWRNGFERLVVCDALERRYCGFRYEMLLFLLNLWTALWTGETTLVLFRQVSVNILSILSAYRRRRGRIASILWLSRDFRRRFLVVEISFQFFEKEEFPSCSDTLW